MSLTLKIVRLLFMFFTMISGVVFAQCPVIPSPVVYKEVSGEMAVNGQLSVDDRSMPDNIKEHLIRIFNKERKIRLVFSNNGKDLQFKKVNNTIQDYYSVNINDGIIIQYSSERSCFYALQTLLQLTIVENGEFSFKKCFVQDYPKFQWRGLHLDVSRHFFAVEEVKRYIDLMAMYKYNTFHWHLTDDQGWRIEIKKYPKLTEIGAWRDSTVNDHYSTNPRTYKVERYGGFYSQDQVREIVEYASKRYITVVPEIEMPGHSRAALAAYPELSCTGDKQEVPGLWGVFDDIYCTHESTIDFLKNVLDEVLDLFPSEYIHIGGDEAPKSRWAKCKKCQAVIRENGLKDEHELQSWFVGRMDEFLTQRGRKLIGWDEILEGGLSPNATVMSWRGFEGGIAAAKLGHYVVMSPGSHCYFDHYQSTNPNEPLAIGGYTPLEKVYEFDPIPSGFTPEQQSYILGGQANLWTEYIPDMKQLEYMTYPRALALSQALWCISKPSFDDFKRSFVNYHIPLLQDEGVNFSRALFYPKMDVSKAKEGLNVHFKSGEPNYHFNLFVRSDEKLPAMSGGQVVGEKDTLYFQRTIGEKQVNYAFSVTSEVQSEPSIFKFKVHPSIGLPVQLITKPDSRYSGNGSSTIVDGIKGSKPWKGHEWLGYDTTYIELIADMSKISTITGFEIGFLKDDGSWIQCPEKVDAYYSKNNKKWKKIKNSDTVGLSKITEEFKLNFLCKGRYLKLVVKPFSKIPLGYPGEGNVPWTFIDELIIFFK